MSLKMAFAGIAAVAISAAQTASGVGLKKMYWSDREANTIRRANLDGTQVETLVSGLGEARGVAVDLVNHQLYWVDNGTNKIQRSLLDGSHVEDLVTTGLAFPAGIVLDVANNTMYWADTSRNEIQRANLDGSQPTPIVTKLGDPYFLALDLIDRHLYWTDYGEDKIQRSNLDGSGIVDLVTTGLDLPRGIDLDLVHGKMYWADRGTDKIQRANLDGSQIETLHMATPSIAAPHGVAVDVERQQLYWVDNGLVTIERSGVDGTDRTVLLDGTSGVLSRPWQIVLDLRTTPIGCAGMNDCPDEQQVAAGLSLIDGVTAALGTVSSDPTLDYDRDGAVTLDDQYFLVHFVLNSQAGDTNLDGLFSTDDLVRVFQAGQYEDSVAANSRWATGDWSGDGEFTSHDLVLASQAGYSGAATRAAPAVPEPAVGGWAILAALVVGSPRLGRSRRLRSRGSCRA
jgi:DNA-binding beta-propeller fold protein YncE